MEFTLDDRYTLEDGRIYVSGIQALVRTVRDRALLDRQRGLRTGSFISGYEGSPLAGYDMGLARRMRLMDGLSVVHRPAVNEELAATSVMGTQLAAQVGSLNVDGVTGYWYGKGPGLDRASDAIRHANMIGTDPQGGAVAFVGDDPAAKSSSVTCYSEFALADLQVPTLYPADPQEVLDLGIHAAYLSLALRPLVRSQDRHGRGGRCVLRRCHARRSPCVDRSGAQHLPPGRQSGRPGPHGARTQLGFAASPPRVGVHPRPPPRSSRRTILG